MSASGPGVEGMFVQGFWAQGAPERNVGPDNGSISDACP